MEKITFVDGVVSTPAKVTIDGTDYNVTDAVVTGTTPLNANNLNQMQANAETAINANTTDITTLKEGNNIITVGLTSDYTTTSSSASKLNLSTVLSSNGTKLTWNSTSQAVKIGTGVSKVKVSGQLLQTATSANLWGCYITKNGTTLGDAVAVGFNYVGSTGQFWQTSISPVLIDVSANDLIYFVMYSQNSASHTAVAYSGRSTNMTVEVIK